MNELLRPESQQDGLSRLVVTYEIKDTGEVFNWGMAGEIPAMSLLGYITRVQGELAFRNPKDCEHSALIITWDRDKKELDYCVHPSIPIDSLVGMLELIKAVILTAHMGGHTGSRGTPLLGPDGKPMRGRR